MTRHLAPKRDPNPGVGLPAPKWGDPAAELVTAPQKGTVRRCLDRPSDGPGAKVGESRPEGGDTPNRRWNGTLGGQGCRALASARRGARFCARTVVTERGT